MIDDGGLASRDADAPPWMTDHASARRCDGMRIPVALHESDNPDMRRCLRCGSTSAYEVDVDRYCPVLRTSLWTPRPWSDDRWDIGHSQASPYAEYIDALNERDVADRLREPLVSVASAAWPKVREAWEHVPRIDALQLGRWLARLSALLAAVVLMNVATVWLIIEQERERAEQYDAIEQRLREMERQNAVMLDRLVDIRERDTVRYDEQLDAWVVIERAR